METNAGKEVLVEVKDVSFSYRQSDPVLSHVTATVYRGDFFGIIGPNGSGKSTLLKIMLGLVKPSTGTVRLMGEDPVKSRKRVSIGYVSQYATYFERNFPANAFEVALMGRVPRAGLFHRLTAMDRERAMRALRTVGMEAHAQRKIGELSSGQQQRVMIARALATDPDLLILDEPTVGVDVNAETEFYQLMRKLNVEEKLTIIIVTHDMDIVGHQVNKLMCLHCSIAVHGTPKQFLEGEGLHSVAGRSIQLIPHHEQHHHEPGKHTEDENI